MARGILRRLKFDNDTTDRVCRLVHWHDDNPELSGKAIRRAVHRIGVEQYPALFAVKRADILGAERVPARGKAGVCGRI